jgi:ABC-type antimicrobial peptide transport system permease subunit
VTGFVVSISMSLSLISVGITIRSNLYQQTKEIVSLRCIGLEKGGIVKIFLYESIIMIAVGGIIGILTGTIVGGVIVAQNALWLEAQPVLIFPWKLFGFVIGVGVLFSVVFTWRIVLRFLRVDTCKLIRGEFRGE